MLGYNTDHKGNLCMEKELVYTPTFDIGFKRILDWPEIEIGHTHTHTHTHRDVNIVDFVPIIETLFTLIT